MWTGSGRIPDFRLQWSGRHVPLPEETRPDDDDDEISDAATDFTQFLLD